MTNKICENCKYCEEFNGQIVCIVNAIFNLGSPEELPEKRTCEDCEQKFAQG